MHNNQQCNAGRIIYGIHQVKLNVHGVEVLQENVPCCAFIGLADNNIIYYIQ